MTKTSQNTSLQISGYFCFLGLVQKQLLWKAQPPESQHQEHSNPTWTFLRWFHPAFGQEKSSSSPTNDCREGAICQPLRRGPRAYAQCSVQTSLSVPGTSTTLWLHLFNSGKQAIAARGFPNAAAAVWVYYIYTFYGSSLPSLCTYSVLVTSTRGADSGVLGTDRLLQPLRLPFPLDLSECHLYFQSCCRLYLLLGYSESRRPSCLHKVSSYTTLGVSSGKPDGNTSSEFTAVPLLSYRDCSQTETLKRDLWTCKCP